MSSKLCRILERIDVTLGYLGMSGFGVYTVLIEVELPTWAKILAQGAAVGLGCAAVGVLIRLVFTHLLNRPIARAIEEYEKQLVKGWKIRVRQMNATSVHLLDLHGRVLADSKGIPLKEADEQIREWIKEAQDDNERKEGEAWAALDSIDILYPHVREAWDDQKRRQS